MANEHTYGSGELSFARFLPDTEVPGAFRYLGNTPEFSLSAAQENLDHWDVDHGIRYKDDSVVTQMEKTGNIVTDNLNQENLALFFTGTTGILAQSSATGEITDITEIQMGTYILGQTDANPTGDRHVASVVVTNGLTAGSLVTYVAGTDYVVDSISGTVTFIEGGTIEAGDRAKIVYNVAANSRTQIISGNDSILGALRFKSFNPVGPKRDILLPKVRMTPDGDFPLKGDDWLTIPFALEVLKRGELAQVYIDGVATV